MDEKVPTPMVPTPMEMALAISKSTAAVLAERAMRRREQIIDGCRQQLAALPAEAARIARIRKILPALVALEPGIPMWSTMLGEHLTVNLGTRPHGRVKQSVKDAWSSRLKRLFTLLGRLPESYRDVMQSDAKEGLATVTLNAADYPGVSVTFKVKVDKKSAKCRIQKRVSYQLVCSR